MGCNLCRIANSNGAKGTSSQRAARRFYIEEKIRMVRTIKAGLGFAVLTAALLLPGSGYAQDPMKPETMKQDSMKEDSMKQDPMKQDKMQDDKMMHDGMAKTLETGKFHGKVHKTEGRATLYQEAD